MLRLAASAFVVLAAEPSFVLVDTAVVGHLGPLPLGALHWHWGIGGVWAGLAGFIGARLVGMLARTARGRWAVTGPMARGA
jgi:Na+-driven multidrug efflux pump